MGLLKGLVILSFFYLSWGHTQSCKSYFKTTHLPENIRDIQTLRIATYNMLNLYVHLGDLYKDHTFQIVEKPSKALFQMAETFRRHPFDILVAEEVESLNSARLFNRDFLNGEYEIYSTETRDIRGLFVVFFVKKSLPFKIQMDSHIHETWRDPLDGLEKEVFPRDLPTLHLMAEEGSQKPLLTILGAHLKSLRDRTVKKKNGKVVMDEGSYELREAQAHRATRIIQRYQNQYGFSHPIILAGDFNNAHNYASEFYGFSRHAKLTDSLSLIKENLFLDKVTHTYFGEGFPLHRQLDGILLVPSLIPSLKDSYVIPYYNEKGQPVGLPQNKKERRENPSDHWPVMAEFDFTQILGID